MPSMTPAEDLADVMAAEGLGTVAGVNPTIYSGRIPSSPDSLIAVKDLPGASPVRAMGGVGAAPLLSRPDVQVTVRDADWEALWTTVDAVKALFGWWNGSINGRTYELVQLAYEPIYLGEDENERHLVSLVFHCNRQG